MPSEEFHAFTPTATDLAANSPPFQPLHNITNATLPSNYQHTHFLENHQLTIDERTRRPGPSNWPGSIPHSYIAHIPPYYNVNTLTVILTYSSIVHIA